MYRIIDYYEELCGELIGKADTLRKAQAIAREWDDDTDGECSLEIIDGNGKQYTY